MRTRTLTRTTWLLIALTCVTLASVGSALGLWVARSHPILPGVDGCRTLTGDEARIDCVADRVTVAMRADGIGPALEAAERSARDHLPIAGVCHQAMHRASHRIGPALEEFRTATRVGSGECATGLQHGVMELAVERGDTATAAAFCGKEPPSDATDRRASNCFHGIGHGLRREESTPDALEACAVAAPYADARQSCASGVFMEHGFQELPALRRAGNPIPPCDAALGSDDMPFCWYNVPDRMQMLEQDLAAAPAVCAKAPDTRSEAACGQGAGALMFDARSCGKFGSDLAVTGCFAGWASRTVLLGRSVSVSEAAAVCEREGADTGALCAEVLGFMVDSLGADAGKLARTCREEFSGARLAAACTRADPAMWSDPRPA